MQRTSSALFRYIEDLQGDLPWGSFLDAGTGTHSIGWVSSLATERWTAVSGAEAHAMQVRDVAEGDWRPQDRTIVANWADERLLAGERYDTVLADYLLGAVEGFTPYFQEQLFTRLRPHVEGMEVLRIERDTVPFGFNVAPSLAGGMRGTLPAPFFNSALT